jgi:cysteine desulfurase
LTTEEVAAFLKVSDKTVLRLAKDGVLGARKVGRAWRFCRSDVLAYFSGRQDEPAATRSEGGVVYLDYNATSPLDPRVLEVMLPYFTGSFGNPASSHAYGALASAAVEVAREQVARLVGARKSEVVFTSGATEANNQVLRGLVHGAPGNRTRLVVSAGEHKSILETARALAAAGDAKVDLVPLGRDGHVDLDALGELLADDVLAVSVATANPETGVLAPIAEIAAMTHEHGAVLHTDATQAVARIEFDMSAVGADLLSMSAHKLAGPKGVGALVVRRRLDYPVAPLLYGGGQEHGLRSGTVNVPGVVGFGAAAALAFDERVSESIRVGALRNVLEHSLIQHLSDVARNGHPDDRLPNTLNLRFGGADADAVMVNMPEVAVSTGSACSSSAIEPSHVLVAMGQDRDEASEALRFSLGRFTTRAEIETAVAATIRAVTYVRAMNHVAKRGEI